MPEPLNPTPIPSSDVRTTDENLPFVVAGQVQWRHVGLALAALMTVLTPVLMNLYSKVLEVRTEAAKHASDATKVGEQAKAATEATYQVVTKPTTEDFDRRLRVLEQAALRAQVKPGRRASRPLAVVVPPRPVQLPNDTNAAEAILKAKMPGAPPQRPMPVDAAAP